MSKFLPRTDSFRLYLQNFVASLLFPSGKGDWYKQKGYASDGSKPHINFCQEQMENTDARYYKEFQGLSIQVQTDIPSILTNSKTCGLESFICKPDEQTTQNLPGSGKHIIYFPGANTYYQACFRDISTAARETGATVHAFNFPGTGLSTGKVTEANDLTNAGLAMVKHLLRQGVKPDDIILQGDCFGAGIAMEVKYQLENQSDTKVRIIMNNAFKSFKAAVYDMITSSQYLPNFLKPIVKPLLEFAGWHVKPGKRYVASDPYQCLVQHQGDRTLTTATLSDKVQSMRDKTDKYEDRCPDEYRSQRDELEAKSTLRIKKSAEKRLKDKFGNDKYGRANTHFADLCEMETLSGRPAYADYVNQFLSQTNEYIGNHPQTQDPKDIEERIKFLNPTKFKELDEYQRKQAHEFVGWMINPEHAAQELVGNYPPNRPEY